MCINWSPNGATNNACDDPPEELVCSLLRSIPCDADNDPCASAMTGAFCDVAAERCTKPCSDDSDCTLVNDCLVTSQLNDNNCGAENNACYAVRQAEIWAPCNEWTPLGSQEHARMYHSTTMLLPDGRVISMGGGHRDQWGTLEEQTDAEYFAPRYSEFSTAPAPEFHFPSGDAGGVAGAGWELPENYLEWDGEIEVMVHNDTQAARATLVRLGSTTHGFDMSQRFLRLGLEGSFPSYTVKGPESGGPGFAARNIAPPGYYMLFLLSDLGEPSVGRYIRVGAEEPAAFVCEATGSLAATETSCAGEPIGGACPSGSTQTSAVALPQVTGPSGSNVNGFEVVVPPGMVVDVVSLTTQETVAVQNLCVSACQAHFAGRPGQNATCEASGAFLTPKFFASDVAPALDLVRPDERKGQGLFAGEQLTCDLGVDCYTAFDEALAVAAPNRVSPAKAMLAVGEEYRVALGSGSKVSIVAGSKTYTSALTGSIGYSFCEGGNASEACSFQLTSLSVLAASSITPTVTCDDGTTMRQTLSNLVVGLGQPAVGMAPKGAGNVVKGFPSGGLILESAFDVGGEHFTSRRPARTRVYFDADGTSFSASNLPVTLKIPCNGSEATITALFSIEDPGGAALAEPPTVAIDTPATVSCSGSPTVLSASGFDPDGDLADVRMFVDDVLMAPGLSQVTFSEGHTLKAVASDARGAATTSRKAIQCL